MYNVFLNNDPTLQGGNFARSIDEQLANIRQLEQQLSQYKQSQPSNATPIWDEIDNIVSSLSDSEKELLAADGEFNESNSKFIPGRHTMGFYSLFLKETKGCVINYGKTKYDFDGQTIVSIAPDQVVGYESVAGVPKKAKGILFHPDFLHGTSLERKMKDYTFFSYASNEALHLSEDERKIIADCMAIVSKELQNPIDRHTKSLITTNIELILDYCLLSASVRI